MKSVDDVVAELRLKVAKNLARYVGIVSIDCDDALALCQMAADFAVMLAEGKRAISALQSEADRLREALAIQSAALLEARATFQEYVRLHRAKSPPDEAKAQANVAQADKIGVALAKARAALSATQQDASPVQPAQKTEGA